MGKRCKEMGVPNYICVQYAFNIILGQVWSACPEPVVFGRPYHICWRINLLCSPTRKRLFTSPREYLLST
ncbi:hypothetical protein, partial [Roseovarius sp.]|uniref:hypothetical protein n=1 Tax=Roseovarius sp. TaxID=1486281 RepID=UPI003569D017